MFPGSSRQGSAAEQAAPREDVQRAIAQMRADLAGRGSRERENPALDRFLNALEAVVDGLPGRIAKQGRAEPAQPNWARIPGQASIIVRADQTLLLV